MRTAWPAHFPPVFVHTYWEAEDSPAGAPGLSDHVAYSRAKKRRDARAAREIVTDFLNEDALNGIFDVVQDFGGSGKPLVVAPAATPDQTGNALAITLARVLALEMEWEVEEHIFQARRIGRDANGAWYRLAHEPDFYGPVLPGRTYVLADDVLTLGGTLAALRGFIERNGGRVACMSALAHRSGGHVQIALARITLDGLRMRYGNGLDRFCREELGYGAECLTEQEGQRLLRGGSLDAVRAALNGARDA